MIKKEELRIGNIITHDGVIATVRCIHYNYLTLGFNIGGNETLSDVKYDMCDALPISPSILEKCGFVFEEAGHNDFEVKGYWGFNGVELTEFTGDGFQFGIESVDDWIELDNVHKMQNAVYIIHGYELPLSL